MPKVIAAFVGTEALQTFPEQRRQRVDGSTAGGANEGLQLGEAELDGIEIGAVGRQIPQRHAGCLERILDTGDLVRAEIIGDDEVAGLQRQVDGV